MNDTRVLLVDDHALVRGALADRLQSEPGLSVVATASSAEEAVEKARECAPDVVVSDIDMPGSDCFDAARRIHAFCPKTRVIFLSAYMHDRYIEQALDAKANGYLTKREPPEAVIAAIREVASGGAYFSPEIQARIVVDASGVKLADEAHCRSFDLTRRQVEVLRYISQSLSKKEIATIMGISVKTVDRHVTNLMERLNIHDRVELARFAIREGFAEA